MLNSLIYAAKLSNFALKRHFNYGINPTVHIFGVRNRVILEQNCEVNNPAFINTLSLRHKTG
jgi:hypothetical protein